MWVLGIDPWSPARTVRALSCWAISRVHSMAFFFWQLLPLAWASPSALGCLTSKPQGFCLFSLSQLWVYKCKPSGLVTWTLGVKLKSSRFPGKHFINWPISAYPVLQILKKKKSGMGPPVQVKTPVEASGTRLLKRKRTFSRDRVAAQI